jgi:hypothetical protein
MRVASAVLYVSSLKGAANISALTVFLALAACAPQAKAPEAPARPAPAEAPAAKTAGYDSNWSVTQGWPGEYPAGFTILADGVVVKGRASMDMTAPQTIDCPLHKLAHYQLWNEARNKTDNPDYKVATLRKTITVTSDGVLEYPGDAPDFAMVSAPVKVGDTIVFTRYLGEGWSVYEFQGKEIELEDFTLTALTDMDKVFAEGNEIHEWLEVPCKDAAGTRAWLFLDEVLTHPDIGPAAITGFGEAADITEADIPNLRQAKIDQMAEDGAPT